MLIRPDGYIAFQGADAITLMTYLSVRSGLLKGAGKTAFSEIDAVELPLQVMTADLPC